MKILACIIFFGAALLPISLFSNTLYETIPTASTSESIDLATESSKDPVWAERLFAQNVSPQPNDQENTTGAGTETTTPANSPTKENPLRLIGMLAAAGMGFFTIR